MATYPGLYGVAKYGFSYYGQYTPSFDITVNGVDITSKVLPSTIEKTESESASSIRLKAVNITEPVDGQTITVALGGEYIFQGFVNGKVNKTKQLVFDITGYDKLIQLKWRSTGNISFNKTADPEAGVVSDIFETLVTDYGGLTADSTTIQSSSGFRDIDEFICRDTSVFDACKRLADRLGWIFYYNSNTDKVYFEPKGYTTSANVLTVGTDVFGKIQWEEDGYDISNTVTLTGAVQRQETSQSFTGDDVTTSFTLSYSPEHYEVVVDGTRKIGGIAGSTLTYDYTVDYENKSVDFTSAPGTGLAVVVNYAYDQPTPVVTTNSSSKSTYSQRDRSILLEQTMTVDDVEQQLQADVDKLSQPFSRAKFKILLKQTGPLNTGNKYRIVDSVNTKDEYLAISKQVINIPGGITELEMGDKSWKMAQWGTTLEEKTRRLEEQKVRPNTLERRLIPLTQTIPFQIDSITVWSRTIEDTWITGHPNPDVRKTPNKSGNRRSGVTEEYTETY